MTDHWKDQPREPAGSPEGGRWASATKAAMIASGLQPSEQKLYEKIEKHEDEKLRGLDHEQAYFFDRETGEVIMHLVGQETEINLTDDDRQALRDYTAQHGTGKMIMTHNHPTSGVPHSPDDIMFGFAIDAYEMRVVGRFQDEFDVTYILRKPSPDWKPDAVWHISMLLGSHDVFNKLIDDKKLKVMSEFGYTAQTDPSSISSQEKLNFAARILEEVALEIGYEVEVIVR